MGSCSALCWKDGMLALKTSIQSARLGPFWPSLSHASGWRGLQDLSIKIGTKNRLGGHTLSCALCRQTFQAGMSS